MRFEEDLYVDEDPRVVCWKDINSTDEQVELRRLDEWVNWLTGRYHLDYKTIPSCWQQHGSLVEELAALRTMWEGSFQDDAAPSDAIAFHRELDASLRRLREWNSRSGCSRTTHRAQLAE
ncbi:hypothetical protein [Kribbella lupini]|uniref:Uncharacterized protein n=1 Tax=Kribbella lupini TaxID=291602 RepID=A0ABP4NES0_9ACTN